MDTNVLKKNGFLQISGEYFFVRCVQLSTNILLLKKGGLLFEIKIKYVSLRGLFIKLICIASTI